jgi:hypothetical protein
MVHGTACLQRTIKMISPKYDHIMAKPPRNMAWLGHANLPKTKQTKQRKSDR